MKNVIDEKLSRMPAYGLKEINICPVCRSSSFENIFAVNEYTGRMCEDCGLVYISPVDTDPVLLYTDDHSSSPSRYYEQTYKTDKKTFSERLDLISKFAGKEGLLDIGCSTGTFLGCAEDKSWNDVLGIDPNPASAAICRKNGLNIFEGFFNAESAKKLGRNFDVVNLGDIIEHFSDPADILNIIKSKLTGGGVIAIATPNFESFFTRKFQVKPREHLIYFDEGSLRYLLKKCSLKVVHFEKTTRIRGFKALKYSTTFQNKPLFRALLNVFHIPGMSFLANLLIKLLVRDELLVIARKE